MMTFAEAENLFINELQSVYDAGEAKSMVYPVIQHLTGVSKSNFLLNKSQQLAENDKRTVIRIIAELKTGKPLQYILGETEFYGLRLKVNSTILIPRPETEELVEWVLKDFDRRQVISVKAQISGPGPLILDIGTGSGCIAVAIKKNLPEAKVYGVDKFEAALQTAADNASLNHVEIQLIRADLLTEAHLIPDLKYTIIISNPPYITALEKEEMHTNVIEHEPHSALFVPDNNPLIFYDHISEFAKKHLVTDGVLYLEINENFGKETMDLLKSKGFESIELRKDLQNKHRMIRAVWTGS